MKRTAYIAKKNFNMCGANKVGLFDIARLIGFNGKTRSLLKLPNSHITYRFLHHNDHNLLLRDVMIPPLGEEIWLLTLLLGSYLYIHTV